MSLKRKRIAARSAVPKPAKPVATGALTRSDKALVKAASDTIRKRYRYDWQEVGSAIRTRSGKVFGGVSLDAYLGRMAVCAEAVALGQAIAVAGEFKIETIVAVRHPRPGDSDRSINVVSPCGACRELIWDYDRDARVIVPGKDGPEVMSVRDLLPNKYSRERGD